VKPQFVLVKYVMNLTAMKFIIAFYLNITYVLQLIFTTLACFYFYM